MSLRRWHAWSIRWTVRKSRRRTTACGPKPDAVRSPRDSVAATLGALMPENAVIADESVSFGRGFFSNTKASPPHDWLNVTGGAIGGGMPMATGAALGAPGRRVINLQADGSAMYTLQALWTQAREKLDITTVLLSNRKYQILLGELANVGANPGRTALDMMDIGNPDINWPSLAQSIGSRGSGDRYRRRLRRSAGSCGETIRTLPDRIADLTVPDHSE